MDDIIKYDVRTYVEALIKKEFSSKKNEEEVLSNKGDTIDGLTRHGWHRPLLQLSVEKERLQTKEN